MFKLIFSSVAVLCAFAHAQLGPRDQETFSSNLGSSGVTWNAADAAWKTYDYVVVGGGLTGLTVAGRLAENPSTKILVIEAGGDNRGDPRVYDIYKYGQAFNSDLDWQFPTERGNIAGGKTLGGSSSINGAAWTRASKAQYDAWGQFLKPEEAYLNWTWSSMFSYMNKAETFSPPNSEQRAKGADSVNDYHGFSGPVQVTFPSKMYGGLQQGAFVKSIQSAVGIKKCADISGGEANCVAYTPNSINWRDSDHRSSAASAYLTPVENTRKNWLTLVNHQVTKLLWTSDNSKFAYGVEFRQTDFPCTPFQVYVTKEVILAAGAINTPAILQRSGVGDPAVMNPLGISTVLNIPTVGKNLQEQTMSVLASSGTDFDPKGDGPSDVIAFPNLYELFGNDANSITSKIWSSLGRWAKEQASSALSAKALQTIYEIQAKLIIDNKVPVLELFYNTGWPDKIGILSWPLLPWSRGTVKIISADAFIKPQTTVNFFGVDMDMTVQIAGARLARKVMSTPPLSDLRKAETTPRCLVPDNATDEEWKTWVYRAFMPVSHPIGTCSMMRQDLGGVVDGRLKLYGAKNVRIVDASVMPTQVSAHLSSTLYGIAEKVADMIKAGL